jgi:hypothetical protein
VRAHVVARGDELSAQLVALLAERLCPRRDDGRARLVPVQAQEGLDRLPVAL